MMQPLPDILVDMSKEASKYGVIKGILLHQESQTRTIRLVDQKGKGHLR